MKELLGYAYWVFALFGLFGLLWIANYVVVKLGVLFSGRRVEVSDMFLCAGAFAGIVLVPSRAHPSTEATVIYGAHLLAGAFVGGLIGLAVELHSERKASQRVTSPDSAEAVPKPHWSQGVVSAIGEVFLFLLMIVCGAIVVGIRLGDMPILSPLIEHLRRLF